MAAEIAFRGSLNFKIFLKISVQKMYDIVANSCVQCAFSILVDAVHVKTQGMRK